MKDYDIKIKNSKEITFFGTDNDTIVVPSNVKFDSDKYGADIDIIDCEKTLVGIPSKAAHLELNIENAHLIIKDLSYEKLEIDAKGKITIEAYEIDGPVDINMAGGEAELILPSDYRFRTVTEGKNNRIICDAIETPDSKNVIELNGKNSTLTIKIR